MLGLAAYTSEQSSWAAQGPSPSYRAPCGRDELVRGKGKSLVAEVGVQHFLEDNAAVGKQQTATVMDAAPSLL